MTTFVKGRTIKTAAAQVAVDAGLAAGTHRFQLVVVSSDGRSSAPQVVDVLISRPAILRPRPSLTAAVTPLITPIVHPLAAATEARRMRVRKTAKPRSET